MMKLRGINISLVKIGNNHNEQEIPEQVKIKENYVPKNLADSLKTKKNQH